MTHTFTTDDPMEALRIVKSGDMSLALWDIRQLGFRDDLDFDSAMKEIRIIFDRYNINLTDLVI